MNKRFIAFLSILSLLVFLPLIPASAAVKAGDKCTKVGIKSVVGSKTFTCIKSGSKLVWNKGVEIKNPTPRKSIRDWATTRSTDLGYINDFRGPCDLESDLPTAFKELQNAFSQKNYSCGIYRIAKYELGTDRPKTKLDSDSSDLAIKNCEISEPKNSRGNRGFFNLSDACRRQYSNSSKVPGPKMTVQVIPIYASDTERPKNSPEADYGRYTDVLSSWAKYSSDGESAIEIRYPDSYIEFSNKVSSYNIYHENNHDNPAHMKFVKDLVQNVDSKINFSGSNLIIVVVPPGTPLKNFQQGVLRDFVTNEGSITHGSTMYPFTLTGLETIKFSNFLTPFFWLHELYHAGYGLDDHYGDYKEDVNTEYGLGQWSLMTPYGGDLSAWEKWILGFITDSQVHCVNPNQSTTRWIAPSSVKSKEKKLVVIPISQTKGIVLESIRAAGLYYKISKESEGLLPYVVDLEIVGHGLGMKLILPTNRNPNQPPFFLSQAPLREGESVVSNGFKITVVESGTFGDVVKVEKVA